MEKIKNSINNAWQIIPPAWPLDGMVASNPLRGFEQLPFDDAVKKASRYFQQQQLPTAMHAINRETIKWCQVLFDTGQAVVGMPNKSQGLFAAWRQLIVYDARVTGGDKNNSDWISALPVDSSEVINLCLQKLHISDAQQQEFLTRVLATLSGWASYIKYQTEWSGKKSVMTQAEFLAMRMVLITVMWPDAHELCVWDTHNTHAQEKAESLLQKVTHAEKAYHADLRKKLIARKPKETTVDAQCVFCIDVRSEPLRRSLESVGAYQTFGGAGFFGLPITLRNELTGDAYASCPVLLNPQHAIVKRAEYTLYKQYQKVVLLKRLYQSTKYAFAASFALVETSGLPLGIWMAVRTFFPRVARAIQSFFVRCMESKSEPVFNVQDVPFEQQCAYAESFLRAIGLTKNFAFTVVLSGHASDTTNNAYASALDCGACGGRDGSDNARIMCLILNDTQVRKQLNDVDIFIPATTVFIPACHNTTTNAVTLFADGHEQLKKDFVRAAHTTHDALRKSTNWAETRPEWGLARNASFIIGPRWLTRDVDLDGRAFLHSYKWEDDTDGSILAGIMTAPAIVGQWINSQYLFSTLDPIAYGSGSKITHNITGKIGVMQGNASDLMHGLSVQSLYLSDTTPYHEPCRLLIMVYAPRERVDAIIKKHEQLRMLVENKWIKIECIEPQ